MKFARNNLLYEWNQVRKSDRQASIKVEINDETIRDGIQASGIRQPSLAEKLKIIECMAELGIDAVCVGFPAVSTAMRRDIEEMVRYILAGKFSLKIACAGRTLQEDIQPIVDLSQKFGIPIDANIFVASSPVRQLVENWDMDHLLNLTEKSVNFAVKNHLPVMFATEDTSRSKPGDLRKIYLKAIQCGAYRICLADTVGYAAPRGVTHLVTFFKSLIEESGRTILLDWHGHNDRGLALANALTALEAGVNRIHATGLGLGERTGNTSMEQLLVNLELMGLRDIDLTKLKDYSTTLAKALGYSIPINFPMVGANAFAIGTWKHTAATHNANL